MFDKGAKNRPTRRDVLYGGTALIGAAATARLWRPSSLMAATPRRGGVARISVTAQMTTLVPFKQGNNPEYMTGEMMYSGLVRVGPDMVPRPDVAESWSANDEASEFVFKMRKGIKFHHGPEVKAQDAVASIKAVLDPETASPGRKNLGPITDVSADDDYTVRVKLDGSFADLPVTMGHPSAKIVPAAILEKGLDTLAQGDYGCGPFKLVEYDPARILKVARYDGYHAAGQPYLDGVEQILYPDLAAESAALLNKETDVMLQVNNADYERISGTAGVVGRRQRTGRFLNLVLRMDTKPFDDLRVRQALAMCIDRQGMVDLVLEGFGRPAYDNPISSEYRYHIEHNRPAYDVAGAKRLHAQAGYPNGVKVELLCSTRPALRTQVGVAVKEMARAAGFDIEVMTVPPRLLHRQRVEERWVLRGELEHAAHGGPDVHLAAHVRRAVGGYGLEQQEVRRHRLQGAADHQRRRAAGTLRRGTAHVHRREALHRAVLPGRADRAPGLCDGPTPCTPCRCPTTWTGRGWRRVPPSAGSPP